MVTISTQEASDHRPELAKKLISTEKLAMITNLFLFAFLFLACSDIAVPVATLSIAETITTRATDQKALMSFRSLIRRDPFQALDSWSNQSIPMCQWRGVSCGTRGRRRGRVIALDLPELGLIGAIDSSLSNLTYLRRLDLSENRLDGILPSELGHLEELKHLDLSSNSIGGEIPSLLSYSVRLQVIILHNNFLRGAIPWELGSLHDLKVLNLGFNNLTGNIPSEIGHLKKLVFLCLNNNMITGEIPPEIGKLQKLNALHMGMNQLTGPLPSSIGNLSSLEFLNLGSNGLTGSIPESLGNLSSLKVLKLTINNLIGSIPQAIGKLNALTEFYLNDNKLEGFIPPSVYNISSLQHFIVQSNELSGSLPSNLGNKLSELQILAVDRNQFDGVIPASLCNASMLEIIQMSRNSFSGAIPECLGIHLNNLRVLYLSHNQIQARDDADWGFIPSLTNCSKLKKINLGGNKLEGMLPNSIANLSTNLIELIIQENMISGRIPQRIGNLVNLTMLYMGSNLLTGTIPTSLGELQRLSELDLHSNNLVGPVPPTLGNLTMLNKLYLDNNGLFGPLPPTLGSCPLESLSLSNNSLAGPIPKEIFLISKLSVYAYFQGNMFTGTLPLEVGKLRNLGRLDISRNRISGVIPASLGECQSMQYLNMHGNLLEGTIPVSMGQLKGLMVLDLSENNLSGSIPDFLGSMQGLDNLNISFNNFKGEVPKLGIFLNTSRVSIEGNYGLCGGIPQFNLPPCSNHTSKKWSHKFIMAISIGCAIVCIVLVCALFALRKRSRKMKRVTSFSGQYMRLSYVELVKATNGFASENLLGTGSFGSVYRGTIMNQDREEAIAVKVLNLQQRGASQSFVAECETLRCVRHRNLVKILTVCSSIDFRGLDFKALVFELMPNGNLDQWLHHHLLEDGNHRVLNFIQRIDIAIDVASALEYLHRCKPVPIVHCDLKPSNILLDNDKVAHVADFGLARFVHQDDTSLPEISSGWATRRGTIGYAAPEYGQGNEVSIYGDTYSYGILLLEMFTGKRPTDGEFVQDLTLHRYVEIALRDQATNVVDQYLLSTMEDGKRKNSTSSSITEMRYVCITSILHIGILCSKELPTDRMQIGDAMRELLGIRDKYRTHISIE